MTGRKKLPLSQWTPAFEGQRPPFAPGNTAALKSGATSELALAPLRVELAASLSVDYPNLDPRRQALLADRLARIALARQWLDEQGRIVRDEQGRVFDVCDRLEKWSSRAESILAELEAERRETSRPRDLAAELAALEAESMELPR